MAMAHVRKGDTVMVVAGKERGKRGKVLRVIPGKGRVLIEHNVLREVELITLWQIEPGSVLRQHLQVNGKAPLYGRTAQILVDERPTVQLLEIVKL